MGMQKLEMPTLWATEMKLAKESHGETQTNIAEFVADDNESDENECKVPLAEEEPISLFLRLNTALSMLSDIFR
uniref:Ovule protein n=1 Tax=Globodera pallida TaxID=36090 RepID=A0A183C2K6_GLOPA